MKEAELVKLGKCAVCGEYMLGKSPLFYKVAISRHGFNAEAIRRRVGMELQMGGPLAKALGPDEHLTTEIAPAVERVIHEECADKVHHLVMLFPS